jgi:uncharacterized protein (DUF1800 family)
MKPLRVVAGVALLLSIAATSGGDAAGRFDVRLPVDKQAVHVLNRLTYGPRPGDLEEVRRVGVEKWIRQQLNPEQISESSALGPKLKPLGSLQLATWQIFETYQQQQPQIRIAPQPSITQLLSQDQFRRLNTGTPEERRAIVTALTPELRRQVLGVAPTNIFEGLPDLKAEAERARQIQEEIRNRDIQEQQRKLRPPLNELLTPEEARDLQRGTNEEKLAVLTALDPEKRKMVFRAMGVQQQGQNIPDMYRREALAAANPQQAIKSELIEAKLQRALYSDRQLEEVLVDFWLNHFNVYSEKGQVRWFLTSYERDAIRPHVLGKFRDLLLATARHPAMLFYLDNYNSRAPADNAPTGAVVINNGARAGLNENYGRELMELHTLGVDGGYTQNDVINVARAFTGWTIFDPNRYGEFQFNPAMHDRGEKVILGQTFPRGGGEDEGVKVIDILVHHPSTAKFIARKLAQRFVADDPPQALIDRMAATFTKTDGDLRAVMETLLLSREFLSEGAWQAKTKSPFEMVASALRALRAQVTDTTAIAQRLTDLGQPLYGKIEPTGYPETSGGWSNSAGLLGRINFANALVAGQVVGVKIDADAVTSNEGRAALLQLMAAGPATETAVNAGSEGQSRTPAMLVSVLIGSPDFQKR